MIGLLHYARPDAFEDPALIEYLRTIAYYARSQADEAAVLSLDAFMDTVQSVEVEPPSSMHLVRSLSHPTS